MEQTKHENRRSCEEAESRVRSELGLKLSMSERRTSQLEGENHALKVSLKLYFFDFENLFRKVDNFRKSIFRIVDFFEESNFSENRVNFY